MQTIGKIASEDVFNVLLTILDVNGLTAVRSGNLYRIIPREGAPQQPVRTIVGSDVDPAVPGDQVMTQIVRLQYVGAGANSPSPIKAVPKPQSALGCPGAFASARANATLALARSARWRKMPPRTTENSGIVGAASSPRRSAASASSRRPCANSSTPSS